MEHQTMTSLGTSATSVVVHELGHQWYGDSVSPQTWPHLWLNEGFATFCELIYWEDRAATYPGQYDAVLDARYRAALQATGTLVLDDTTSVNNMFDVYRVYAKGAMVLYMLRYVVGDVPFREILRAYAADPAVQYGVATTDDFQRVAESVSGLDLDAFFRQWVTNGTGYPSYASSSVWQASGGAYRVWVTIAQTQTSPQSNVSVFEMPMDVLVRTTAGQERVRVQSNQRSQVFEFDVSAQPTSVTIDPDRRILRSEDTSTGTQPLPPYPTIASIGPNPAVDSFLLEYLLDHESRVDIDVFDVAGRRVLRQVIASAPVGVQFETIDASQLASGVYFLRLSTPEGQATRKFVVAR
jgi:aminopeptidase N